MTENIHIAILGPVSAGKSTLLNGIFSNTFSDMKRQKTTMLPQIYQTTPDKSKHNNIDTILEMNRQSNENVLKLREENKYTQENFKELKYFVDKIDDFIELPDKDATYSILDMPGLNCGGGDNMYFNYIKQISKTIDIYILIFDINSGLNTTDEINILTMINNEIIKNKHGYVHVIINKCDDMIYDENGFKFRDDELQDLYDRCKETLHKYLKDIRDNVSISPLCSSELYVYRGIKNNIETIDEKHIDKIIINECGKKELMKLNNLKNKKKFINGLIQEKESSLYNDWMKDTGYNLLKKNIKTIINYYQFIITHHITNELNDINNMTIDNFDDIASKIDSINLRINKLKKKYSNYNTTSEIKELIVNITNKINKYIENGYTSYSASTIENVDKFINNINSFLKKVKELFTNNPFEKIQTDLIKKRYDLLNNELVKNFSIEIFKELYNSKQINMTQFSQSIINYLKIGEEIPITHPDYPYKNHSSKCKYIRLYNKPNIARNTINILIDISEITNNDYEYIKVILEEFRNIKEYMFIDNNYENDNKGKSIYKNKIVVDELNNTTETLEFSKDFIHLIKVVGKYSNNNINDIYKLLKWYFDKIGEIIYIKKEQCYYWMENNKHLTSKNVNEISYIYWKLELNYKKIRDEKYYKFLYDDEDEYIKFIYDDIHILNYKQYILINNHLLNILNTLKDIFKPQVLKPKPSPSPRFINSQQSIIVNTNKIQNIDNEIEEKFEDALSTIHNIDDDLENYNDSDNETTILKKAQSNTSIRATYLKNNF